MHFVSPKYKHHNFSSLNILDELRQMLQWPDREGGLKVVKGVSLRATFISKIVLTIIGFAVLTLYSQQWEVFTCKNEVRDIALTGDTLWAATGGGVVAWNLSDNSYESFTTLNGLLSCDINQVAIDKKGRPWVATKRPAGLFFYENRSWKQINVGGANNKNTDEPILGLEVDRFGNVWIFTRCDKHLWRYDGRTWHKHEGVYGPLALDLQKNLLAVDSIYSSDNSLPDTVRFRMVSFNGLEFVGKWRSKIYSKWCVQFSLSHIALDSKGNPSTACVNMGEWSITGREVIL